MYRLRFYDTVKKQYGIVYLKDNISNAQAKNEFESIAGSRFQIKHCAYKKSGELLI